jgi:hypothetical protein
MIRCLSCIYFPDGTDIYDLHPYTEDGEYLGSKYYDAPLEVDVWYTFETEGFEGEQARELITIYLTDQEHNTWGRTTSQSS